jgi:hypothetical protein
MPTTQKKKSKYINVFSNEGKERMIVRLPGSIIIIKISIKKINEI